MKCKSLSESYISFSQFNINSFSFCPGSLPAQYEFKDASPPRQIAFTDHEQPGQRQAVFWKSVFMAESITGQSVTDLQGLLKTPAGGEQFNRKTARLSAAVPEQVIDHGFGGGRLTGF